MLSKRCQITINCVCKRADIPKALKFSLKYDIMMADVDFSALLIWGVITAGIMVVTTISYTQYRRRNG